MKRVIALAMWIIALATTFVSCQKQELVTDESHEAVVTELIFSSEKPVFDDMTKTEWTGNSIQWTKGDKISVAYTVNGTWQNANGNASGDAVLYKSDQLSESAETAQFNVSTSFTGTTEGKHVFYGVYPAPSGTGFAEAPVATLTIPSIQTPKASSFDCNADLMTAVSGEYDSRPGSGETISLLWTRLVAHADITLKSLKDVTEGETVIGIKLTAQDGANLVGSQKVNLLTNEVTKNNEESNVIELNGGNLSIADGNVEFWACFLPVTLTSLKVEVDTDKATYTREIDLRNNPKTFKQNARNTLSINMGGTDVVRVPKEQISWVLMTSEDDLTDGTYVLVVKNTNSNNYTGALDSSNGSSSAPSLNTSVKTNYNLLTGVGNSVQFDMSVVDGGYKFAVAGQTDNYLYTSDTNNGVRIGTNTNNIWTLTQDEDHPDAYTFKCNGTNRYLGVYETTPDWRCYTSINNNIKERNSEIYLYKKVEGAVTPDTTPIITVSANEITVEASAVTAEFTYTIQNTEVTPEVTVANGATIGNVKASASEGTVTLNFDENKEGVEKSATIVLSIQGAEDVEVIITQKKWVDPTIIQKLTVAEFAEQEDGDVVYELTGTITGIYQEYNPTYGNISFYLDDGTGEIVIFRMLCTAEDASKIVVANVITVQGPKGTHNGNAQMTAGGKLISIEEAAEAPQIEADNNVVTISAAEGAVIYYTTDGSVPTTTSNKYSAPFQITETKIVKAIAVEEGKPQSAVSSQTCNWVDPDMGEAETVTASVVFKDAGYGNGEAVTNVIIGAATVTFEKGTNSNAPKYYDTGKAVRTYGGNNFTIASDKTITKVEFTFASGEGTNEITANSGAYNAVTKTWSGSSKSVKFTIGGTSGHRRIASITVTYLNTDSAGDDEPVTEEAWLELPTASLEGDRYKTNTLSVDGQRNYTHLYDTETKVSLWTAYPLNSSHMGNLSRPNNWHYNPQVEEAYQADIISNSYSGNTYSRGHMIPNGSRNGNHDMQLQTFYVTNSVPQRQDNFNGSIWNALEQAVQAQAAGEEIYVVTGVAFNKVGESKEISYVQDNSSENCAIPNYFYKVVLKVNKSGTAVTSASTVGFWFEHKDYDNSTYADYAVSVDQIEEWTGFDFFVNLPDDVEAVAEQNASWNTFLTF